MHQTCEIENFMRQIQRSGPEVAEKNTSVLKKYDVEIGGAQNMVCLTLDGGGEENTPETAFFNISHTFQFSTQTQNFLGSWTKG